MDGFKRTTNITLLSFILDAHTVLFNEVAFDEVLMRKWYIFLYGVWVESLDLIINFTRILLRGININEELYGVRILLYLTTTFILHILCMVLVELL